MITVIHDHVAYTFAVNGEADFTVRTEFTDLPPLLQEIASSLIEVAVGYIALGRLGCPSDGDVAVEADGPLPETAFPVVERLLSNVMHTRSAVAGMERRGQVHFRTKTCLKNRISTNLDETKVLVPSSGGMDSTAILRFLMSRGLSPIPVFVEYDEGPQSFVKHESDHDKAVLSYLGLEARAPQKMILSPLKASEGIPWRTDQYGIAYTGDGMVQDTDRWEIWGRDLALCAVLLVRAMVEQAAYIDIGHTKENMFSLHQARDGCVFYDRCCRSLHSVVEWNSLLGKIFVAAPAVVASLRSCSKGAIGGYLLEDPKLFALTRSCIGIEHVECGQCFSCVDKIASILANAGDAALSIKEHGESGASLAYNHVQLGAFSWLPRRGNGGVWAKQLARMASSSTLMSSINFQNSIYSPAAILAAMFVLDQKGLKQFIPKEYEAVKAVMRPMDCLSKTHGQYVSNPGFLLPGEFLEDSASLVRENYVL